MRKADLGIYWAKLDDSKTHCGRECAIRERFEAPATKHQKERLQTELLARSNASFMIAGRKADLRNAWAKFDHSKTYLGRDCGSITRVDDPVSNQQKEWLQSELVARSNAPLMIACARQISATAGPNWTIQRRTWGEYARHVRGSKLPRASSKKNHPER